MPLVLSKEDSGEKGAYLKDLFEKTYSDDILERNHIKSKDDLGRVVDCLASTLGSFVNPTNIANILGIPMYHSEEGIIFLSIKEFLLDETLTFKLFAHKM